MKDLVRRAPFQPFAVRLTSGAEYQFQARDDLGASKDGRMIFYFGESQTVRIDTESITEVVEK